MTIFKTQHHFPSTCKLENFIIFKTDHRLYKADYEAVIASKEELRIWSQSTWPEDDFSMETNKEELKDHEIDNKKH